MQSLSCTLSNLWRLFLGHMGGLIAITFWGLSFVSTKVIMDQGGLSPTEAYVYRFTIAYIIMVCISHKRMWCNNARDEFLLLLCGMTGGSIYFIAENTALNMTLTTNVSLLSSLSPLVTILLVGVIYKSERPKLWTIIGSLVAFLGVVCVIFNSISGEEAMAGNPLGDLLALASAVSWAVYSLILKRLNVVYDASFITRKTFFYGLLTCIPFLMLEPRLASPLQVLSNVPVILNIVFLALGASTAAYLLWSLTIKKVGAVQANNYLYLQPIITLIAAAIIFGDPITLMGVAGLVLVLLGLWVSTYKQNHKVK